MRRRREEKQLQRELERAREEARLTDRVIEQAHRETERAREFTDANHLAMLAALMVGAAKPKTGVQ